MCNMRYNKVAQQVLNFFKTGSKAPFPEGAFFFRKMLIMILFNDKMYSKVIIIIKKVGVLIWCMHLLQEQLLYILVLQSMY